MTDGNPPPSERIGRALASWPLPERTSREWDEAADRVMASIAAEAVEGGGSESVSAEELLRAPLPPLPGEVPISVAHESGGALPTMGANNPDGESESVRASRASSLEMKRSGSRVVDAAKLAQLTAQPTTTTEREDSGVIDLAALAAGDPPLRPPPSAPALSPPLATASVVAPDLPAARSATVERPAPRKRMGWLGVASVAAAGAVVGGVIVSVVSSQRAGVPAQVIVVERAEGSGTARASAGSTGAAPMPVPASRGPLAVDVAALPAESTQAENPQKKAEEPLAAANPSQGTEREIAPAAGTGSGASAGSGTPPRVRGTIGGQKSLEAMMQDAVGAPSTKGTPQPAKAPGDSTESAGESVPLRPSLGAINGALGTAMPSARACIEPDSPVSHATITFQSDGSVASVSITEWAAGKPVEACIRAALMKARVPPFAQPTYTVPATIRSN